MSAVGEPVRSSPFADGLGQKHLVCNRLDGLGARLTNLLWTWRLARKIDARLLVVWPNMIRSPFEAQACLDEIFEMSRFGASPLRDDIQIVTGVCKDYFPTDVVKIDLEEPFEPERFASVLPARSNARVSVIRHCGPALLTAGETEQAALEQARLLFARLPFNPKIQAAVEQAVRDLDIERAVAVHVRRGDIVENLRSASAGLHEESPESLEVVQKYARAYFTHCAPTEAYLGMLEAEPDQGGNILFFSDSPEAADPFSSRYGRRLIQAGRLAPPGLTDLQRDVFEQLLMGRCKTIFGTTSTFGKLAACVSRAEFVDVRYHADPGEFVGAYLDLVSACSQSKKIRSWLGALVVRRLREMRFTEQVWGLKDEDIWAFARPPAK